MLTGDDQWRVIVIFSDEPSANYDYVYNGATNIFQTGGFKWTTAEDIKLKHIDIEQ